MELITVYSALTGLCRQLLVNRADVYANSKRCLDWYRSQHGDDAAQALVDAANERAAMFEPDEDYEPVRAPDQKRETLADMMRAIRKLGGINPASVGGSWLRFALRDARSSGIVRKAGLTLDNITRELWVNGLLGKPDQEPDMWETVNAIEEYYQAA
jgi:hypothetical protein